MVQLAILKALESTKDGKVNHLAFTLQWKILCIVDRNHERSVVVLTHFTNFKGIYLILEYNIKNEE